jgi:hypothetical protein
MDKQIVHVDALDTRISVAYQNRMFVADQVFPIVGTDSLSNKFAKYSKQAFRAVIDSLDSGGYPRSYNLSMEPYGYFDAKGHGVESPLKDAVRNNADNPAEVDIQYRNFVQGLIALARELEVINLITTSNITQNTTLTTTNQWSYMSSGASTADPIAAILAQIETIQQAIGVGSERMRLLLPRPVYRAIRTNTIARDYIKYTQNLLDKPISPQNLASALDIEKVIVVDNIGLTSPEGETDALAYNWPSAPGASIALLYYCTGAPAPLTPNFGYIFRPKSEYFPLRTVRDEHGRLTIFISEEYRDTVMVEPNAAFLWVNPI